MKGNFELFFRRPFVLIMLSLLDSPMNKTRLARRNGLSYSHVIKIVDTLNDMGITETENHGRSDIVRLTEEGIKIAEEVKEIVEILSVKEGLE